MKKIEIKLSKQDFGLFEISCNPVVFPGLRRPFSRIHAVNGPIPINLNRQLRRLAKCESYSMTNIIQSTARCISTLFPGKMPNSHLTFSETDRRFEEDHISKGRADFAASHCNTVSTPSSCLRSGHIQTLQIEWVFAHFAACNECLYACITRSWPVFPPEFSMSKPLLNFVEDAKHK